MQNKNNSVTEEQKRAAAFLTRKRIPFEPKSPERLAAEEKAYLEEIWLYAQAGDKMPDGSVCAGVSPETGTLLFAMPRDADFAVTFRDAARYAGKLNKDKTLGHDDWRLPTKEELDILFQNREKGALKETFNLSGSVTFGWYWSSTKPDRERGIAWGQRFSDGLQNIIYRDSESSLLDEDSSVRCVRSKKAFNAG